jgi:hypothetical protein
VLGPQPRDAGRAPTTKKTFIFAFPTQSGLALGHVDQYLSNCSVLDGLVRSRCLR